MENKITPEQALGNLYATAGLAPLTREQHRVIEQSALVLQEAIKPKEEPKKK